MTNKRNISSTGATAKSDPDAQQFWGGATVGYEFSHESFSFGPYARLNGSVTTCQVTRESGGGAADLTVDSTSAESITTVLGFEGSYAWSTDFGVVLPYLRLEWEHEYADNPDNRARLALDPSSPTFTIDSRSVDRDFFNLGVGASVVLPGAWSGFVDYEALLGASDRTNHSFTFGVATRF